MVRIMIVDDHALMRRIVREVIEKENDLEVVAEASNGLEAQEHAAHVKPEVVLMEQRAISQKISSRKHLFALFGARHVMNCAYLALLPVRLSHIFSL